MEMLSTMVGLRNNAEETLQVKGMVDNHEGQITYWVVGVWCLRSHGGLH